MTAPAKETVRRGSHRRAVVKRREPRVHRGSLSVLIPPARWEAHKEAGTVLVNFVDEVIRSRTAAQARRELRDRSESVGLVLLSGLAGVFDGYDPHVVSDASAKNVTAMAERASGFSGLARLAFQQALDASIVVSRDLLKLLEASVPPPNFPEVWQSLARLRSVEVVALVVAAGAERPKSKVVAFVIADEYERAALAAYRVLKRARGVQESPRAIEDAIDLESARRARRDRTISHAEVGRRLGFRK